MDERWYTMDRPKSKYPKMPMLDRAAQFAPFAALTGHKEAVIEQGRITQEKRILSNEEKLEINEKIVEMVKLKSKCRIIYFERIGQKVVVSTWRVFYLLSGWMN